MVGVVYSVNIEEAINLYGLVDFKYIIAAFLAVTLNRFIMAYKWNILLKANDVHISFSRAVKIYYISSVIGILLPATIGGDIVRVFYAAKSNNKKSKIMASIIVERLLGFFILFIISFMGILYFLAFVHIDLSINLINLSVVLFTVILFTTGFFIFSFSRYFVRITDFFLNLFSRVKFIKKCSPGLLKIRNAYLVYRNKPKSVIKFSLLTILEIATVILWCYFSIEALNTDISFIYLTAIIPLIQLLVRLPISLDGFGINEASYVYFLSAIGLPSFLGLSVGLLIHFITIVGIMPGLYFYFKDNVRSEISKEVQLVNK